MKFQQLDSISELIPGQRIVGARTLRADEDYLKDHFPLFPVMPGVLMLEALFQAACWLIRVSDDFECSVLTLKEAKNVKFADFVEPGQTLVITVEILKNDAGSTSLKGVGMKGDVTAVSARLVVAKSTLSTNHPELNDLDRFISQYPKTVLPILLKAGK